MCTSEFLYSSWFESNDDVTHRINITYRHTFRVLLQQENSVCFNKKLFISNSNHRARVSSSYLHYLLWHWFHTSALQNTPIPIAINPCQWYYIIINELQKKKSFSLHYVFYLFDSFFKLIDILLIATTNCL